LIGGGAFGQIVFGDVYPITNNPINITLAPGLMRSQYGWGSRTERQWGRSYQYELPRRREISGTSADISLTSVSGAFVGKIRSDNQRTIINSIEFTNDSNGCADFILRLTKEPDFPILPFSILSINIGSSPFDWYKGIITSPPDRGTTEGVIEYRGFGLRRYLETLQAQTTFALGQDITEVVRTIVQTWIQPFSPITYDATKIDPAAGVVLSSNIDTSTSPIRSILDTLSTMSRRDGQFYIWGVDGDGDFYLKRILLDNPIKTLWVGYQINEFQPKRNYDKVFNVINVHRQPPSGADQSGWVSAGVFNDPSSVAKYGRNEKTLQVPGFFGANEIDLIGQSELDRYKEPSMSGDTNLYQALVEGDYLNNGFYRIVMPLDNYTDVVNSADDVDLWSVNGSGDMSLAYDNSVFMEGSGSIRADFEFAEGQSFETDIDAKGFIKEIRFYIRSNVAGSFMLVGVGDSVYNQHTTTIDIPFADVFVPIVWDVSALNLKNLGKFGIEVTNDTGVSTNVWIDNIEVMYTGHRNYNLELKKSVYSYRPGNFGVKSEWGETPANLADYVATLQAQTNELRYTGEIR
jgi:hypothetical protein